MTNSSDYSNLSIFTNRLSPDFLLKYFLSKDFHVTSNMSISTKVSCLVCFLTLSKCALTIMIFFFGGRDVFIIHDQIMFLV